MRKEYGMTESGEAYEELRPRRRNNLTNEDLDAIAAIIEATHRSRRHEAEDCRFGRISTEDLNNMVSAFKGINPDDLKNMISAFNKFTVVMADNRTVVRRFFLVLVLTGVSGLTIYGYWAKITDTVKKAITGS